MNLYEFATRINSNPESHEWINKISDKGRNDVLAEASDRFYLSLGNRKPIIYKIKAMARGSILDKYPAGTLAEGHRLNRNLFDGVYPWTYPDGWGGHPVTKLSEHILYEVVGHIDQTYQAGKWLKGHLYLILSEA